MAASQSAANGQAAPLASPPPPTAQPMALAGESLRELARRPRLSGRRQELRDLADAVDGNASAERWAGVDIFSAFLRDDVLGPPVSAWPGRILDILTQVFFLAPIAMTWFGLMKATGAYRETLRLKAVAGQTFLTQWQTGFDGHLSRAFYLDQIARDVIGLIVVLVILLAAQWFYHARVDEDQPAVLYRDLARALTAAALELAPRRVSAPEEAAAQLNRAAEQFARTATAIGEVGDLAERAQAKAADGLAAASAAMTGAETATTAARGAAEAAGTAAGAAGSAAEAMAKEVARLTATADTVVSTEAKVASLLEATGSKLGGTVDSVAARLGDGVTASQREMSAAVRDSSARIAESVGTGAAAVRSALAEVSSAGAGYAGQVEQAADILGLASQTVQALPGSVSGLTAGLAEVATQVGSLRQAVTAAGAVLPNGAGGTPPDLRAATTELRAVTRALQEAAAALQGAAARPAPGSRWRPWRRPGRRP